MLVIIRGLPGSGKTHISKVYTQSNFIHHEADHFFENDGEYRFIPRKIKEAHIQCINNTRRDLNKNKDVVVSNTFTTHKELKPYLRMAEKLKVPYTICHVVSDRETIHNIPPNTIRKMEQRWQPTPNESVFLNNRDISL